MRSKASVGEYLAFLSIKYEIGPEEFFYALTLAEENQKSTCGSLSIECRRKLRDKTVLLITKGSQVVAQFPIPREFFLEQNNLIENLGKANIQCKSRTVKNRTPGVLQISDLKNGMKQVNLKVKVLDIPKPALVFTRFGNYANVTNALIADESGTVKLCLWNEQINSVSVGDVVQIENAYASMFRGERQLRIGKNGMLNIVKDTIFLEKMHGLRISVSSSRVAKHDQRRSPEAAIS